MAGIFVKDHEQRRRCVAVFERSLSDLDMYPNSPFFCFLFSQTQYDMGRSPHSGYVDCKWVDNKPVLDLEAKERRNALRSEVQRSRDESQFWWKEYSQSWKGVISTKV